MEDAVQEAVCKAGLSLVELPQGLTLEGDGMQLRVDFSTMARRVSSHAVRGEQLVRVAKVKGVEHPLAVDATAGLGEDSLLLAAAGFTVELYERDPVIAALLEDGLRRAYEDAALSDAASRMHLHKEDSIKALSSLNFQPDVVVLDPMFPARTKSAKVKKKFQLLHHLEQPCTDERALLDAAIAAHPRKVVIKRPAKGPYLAGAKPAYSLEGKSVRYDCLVFAR